MLSAMPCSATRPYEENHFNEFSNFCIDRQIEHDRPTALSSLPSTTSSSKIGGRGQELPPCARPLAAPLETTLEVPGCTALSKGDCSNKSVDFEPQFRVKDSSENTQLFDVEYAATVAGQSTATGTRSCLGAAAEVGSAKSEMSSTSSRCRMSSPTGATKSRRSIVHSTVNLKAPIGAPSRETGGACAGGAKHYSTTWSPTPRLLLLGEAAPRERPRRRSPMSMMMATLTSA